MNELTSARAAWENFYVIIGSSGGALIGLQFAGAALALLFVGIHNAWDTVTHTVVSRSGSGDGTNGG